MLLLRLAILLVVGVGQEAVVGRFFVVGDVDELTFCATHADAAGPGPAAAAVLPPPPLPPYTISYGSHTTGDGYAPYPLCR